MKSTLFMLLKIIFFNKTAAEESQSAMFVLFPLYRPQSEWITQEINAQSDWGNEIDDGKQIVHEYFQQQAAFRGIIRSLFQNCLCPDSEHSVACPLHESNMRLVNDGSVG